MHPCPMILHHLHHLFKSWIHEESNVDVQPNIVEKNNESSDVGPSSVKPLGILVHEEFVSQIFGKQNQISNIIQLFIILCTSMVCDLLPKFATNQNLCFLSY